MTRIFIALTLLLALPLCAQEADRKPSPFPEINREREAAAKKVANSASPKRVAAARPQAGSADRSDVPEGPGVGTACFFVSKAGDAAAASGEDSNTEEFVAAHATYAFGSRVLVTNLANGNTVEVKITDRLTDARRIISVNEAAATQLGFREQGVATVKVEVVRAAEVHP